MSAARRAAVFASLASEADLVSSVSDPSSLDAFCLLSVSVDRAHVSNAALAAASADDDAVVAVAARTLLHARAILKDARTAPQADASEAARAAEAEARDKVFPDLSAVVGGGAVLASFIDALDRAKACGADVVEVPRAFLRAIGANESESVRILRGAFSHDNDALIRALASDFDLAQLRAATRVAAPKSLRAGLSTAGAAFRGGEARERAIFWADRLARIRRCGRKKRGALVAAVESTVLADEHLRKEAGEADSVWDSLASAPPLSTRIALLCDAVFERHIDDRRLVPFGSAEPDSLTVHLDFGSQDVSAVDLSSFASALEVDEHALDVQCLEIQTSMHDAVSQWLAGAEPMQPSYVWPVAEPSERIIAPAMTFSASRLNLFAKCPRRWYYEYLCGAIEDTSTANAVYGKVFHAALESLHRDVRIPADWEAAAVFDRLSGLLDVAFGQAHHEFASQLEYEVLRLRARQVAQHYVRWLYAEAADAPFEIVEIESRQNVSLGGHRFVGFIDRIDRPPGGGPITIFDYKTGRIEDDPEEYLRQVRTGEEAQLALYYAMRRAQGDDVARIALVSIRDARDRTWILALDIVDEAGKSIVHRADRAGVVRATCSSADLERSLGVLTARCDLVTREGVEHFAVGADPPCSYCAYALACRERPARGERIFAR